MEEFGLIPHGQPVGPLVGNLAAFWQQISPIVPVLPTVRAHKSCAVYNLAFEAFHGMEEFSRSISSFEHGAIEAHIGQIPPTKWHLSVPLGTTTLHIAIFMPFDSLRKLAKRMLYNVQISSRKQNIHPIVIWTGVSIAFAMGVYISCAAKARMERHREYLTSRSKRWRSGFSFHHPPTG